MSGILAAATDAVAAAGLVADVLDGDEYVEIGVPDPDTDGHPTSRDERFAALTAVLPAHGLTVADRWTVGNGFVVTVTQQPITTTRTAGGDDPPAA